MSISISTITVEALGYFFTARILNCKVGAAYSPGTSPATNKIAIMVTSKGFTNGVATDKSRTVFGRMARYKEPPPANSFAKDETAVGSAIDTTFILSEPIYQKDVIVGVLVGAGLVTDSGPGGSGLVSIASTPTSTNNSTLNYPKAIARSLSLPFCGDGSGAAAIIGPGSFTTHLQAFAIYGIDCAKGICSDGTVSRTQTLTSMAWRPAPMGTWSYAFTDLGINYTQSAAMTMRWQVYPNIGDTTEVLDSNDNAFAGSTAFASIPLGPCDKGGTYGVSWLTLDPVNGNDANTTVYTSRALAEAGLAVKTPDVALTRVQAFNQSTYGRNTVDAAVILVKDGGTTWPAGFTCTATSVTFTRHSSTTRANAKFTGQNAGGITYSPTHLRLYDMSINTGGGGQLLSFIGTNGTILLDNINMIGSGSGTKPFSGNNGEAHMWYKNVTESGFLSGFQTGNDCMAVLALGCSSAENGFRGIPSVVSCYSNGCGINFFSPSAFGGGIPNAICTFNRAMNMPGALGASAVSNCIIGGNVAERTGNDPTALLEYSAATVDNVMIVGNSFSGNRCNIENNISGSGTDFVTTNYLIANNIFYQIAVQQHSGDTAMLYTGHRDVQYGVICRNNHEINDVLGFGPWPKDYGWTDSSAAGYTLDASHAGTDGGNGNYTLLPGSIALNRLTNADYILPGDLNGNPMNKALGALQPVIVPNRASSRGMGIGIGIGMAKKTRRY